MDFKAFIYFLLIAITGIAGIFFLMNSKRNKKKLLSDKWPFIIGILLLIITVITGVDFVHKVYYKMKSTYTSLNNFPETVETESSDTSNYVRILKTYEPAKYKDKVPIQYYTTYGFSGWWRFPLVYPYAVYCKDTRDMGAIVNDIGKTKYDETDSVIYITPHFNSFIFEENFLAGKVVNDSTESKINNQYLVFDFRTGKYEMINSKESLNKKLNEVNFKGNRTFIMLSDYSTRF